MVVRVMVADLALVGEQDELPQAIERLAFVQLDRDPAAIGVALEVTEDEDGAHEASVLLQSQGQIVLARVGLQLGDEQGGGDPAPLERGGDAQHVVPVVQDTLLVERLEERPQVAIGDGGVQPIELLGADVLDGLE